MESCKNRCSSVGTAGELQRQTTWVFGKAASLFFLTWMLSPPILTNCSVIFRLLKSLKTSGTRRHHPRPNPTPDWPSLPLQKYQAARCRANPNAPRLHLHDAAFAQHSTPTTTDALSVSPASSGRTADTAVPPLSTSDNVTSPAPTAIQQQAAFLHSAHGPVTCNAGGVSATPSLIATQTPEPGSRNAAVALQSTVPAALPTIFASGLPAGNSESVDKLVSKSIVPSIAAVLPSITSGDNSSTGMDFTVSQVSEDNLLSPEGSWKTVSANRKTASTVRPRSKLITVGIQLPPGTLTPICLSMTCFLPS
ncbi:hypothetical protein HPB51_019927 [Rhipicephalus microplus]|uniref:Uncharacterized protein n=1 Tax=Rhipicephalus microplus TaxID=6941 RepID=A0A9J6E3A4_RHIMP|nr:hypothetical protein HPB51_019927 [Rhipicephalus microplus]